MSDTSFLGEGISFPFQIDSSGSIKKSSFERNVEEGIFIVLSTKVGERIMNPEFGCKINELLFEENTPETRALAKEYVITALDKWENRILIRDINIFSPESNQLLVEIDYQMKDTNSFHNYVYPFYLIEKP